MFPLDGVSAFLHQLDALGLAPQVLSPAFLLACYVLSLFIAYRIGRRNTADLNDENDGLTKRVAASNAKRRELRDQKRKLEDAVQNLQEQHPEERLVRAAKERQHDNEELAIQLYQEVLATFGPDLARCCEALAAEDVTEVERFRMLAAQLADIGAQR